MMTRLEVALPNGEPVLLAKITKELVELLFLADVHAHQNVVPSTLNEILIHCRINHPSFYGILFGKFFTESHGKRPNFVLGKANLKLDSLPVDYNLFLLWHILPSFRCFLLLSDWKTAIRYTIIINSYVNGCK